MHAQLKQIYDPRSAADLYSRKELEHIARHEGRLGKDIEPDMPKMLMVARLKANPPSVWPRPVRPNLGSTANQLRIPPYDMWKEWAYSSSPLAQPVEPKVVEVNAEDDMEAQWKAQKQNGSADDQTIKWDTVREEISKPLKMHQLKSLAKSLGVKQSNKDTKATLEQKIKDAQNAT